MMYFTMFCDPEAWAKKCPRWILGMLKEDLHLRIPKIPGLPVVDYSYPGDRLERAIVNHLTDWGICTKSERGSWVTCPASNWLPDITTASGWAHVQAWFRGQELPRSYPMPTWHRADKDLG